MATELPAGSMIVKMKTAELEVRAAADPKADSPSGNTTTDCRLTSTSGWETFRSSLASLASLATIFDAVSYVGSAISGYFQTLSETETCLGKHDRTINNLKRKLATVKDALSTCVCKLDILSEILENDHDERRQSRIITALKANNCNPLKAFVNKVQQAVSIISKAHQEFMGVYKSFEDSLQNERDRLAEHLSTVEHKKNDILWNSILCLLGISVTVSVTILSGAGKAILTGYLSIGCGGKLFLGLGIGSAIVLTAMFKWKTYSQCTLSVDKLKKVERELDQITKASKALESDAKDFFILLQGDFSNKVDILSLACDDQTQVKTQATLKDIRDRTSDLQSKKAKICQNYLNSWYMHS